MLVMNAKTALKDADMYKGKKIFAFCGLAYPRKFFDSLNAAGAKIVGSKEFPDHHPYSEIDFNKLLAQSIVEDAALVTTAKDAIKLLPKQRECIAVAEMTLNFDNPAVLDGMINYLLNPNENR